MAVVGESVTEAYYLRSFLSGFTPRASLKWSDHARANKNGQITMRRRDSLKKLGVVKLSLISVLSN